NNWVVKFQRTVSRLLGASLLILQNLERSKREMPTAEQARRLCHRQSHQPFTVPTPWSSEAAPGRQRRGALRPPQRMLSPVWDQGPPHGPTPAGAPRARVWNRGVPDLKAP
uniref:Uncharacterized protein n=1 Tax=Calidris pygmaea TaxID=425635 RepID=A0A8C3KLS8_9CHAR